MASPLHRRLRDFSHIVFFTGAGLSAESGLPTYRGRGGIWNQYNYEEYACQRAFNANPEKVWNFHDVRRERVAACQPSAGHRVIAEVQQAKPSTIVVTQNIDGLHQRAGCTGVVELHGSIWRIRCDRDGIVQSNTDTPLQSRRCACGAYWRPDIVWFEDMLNPATLEAAANAMTACDLLVSVGTSGVVYPAAALPEIASSRGATTIEINLEDTPASYLYQHHLRGKASELLTALWP